MAELHWTDEQLIQFIQVGGTQRKQALQYIFKQQSLRRTAISHVQQHGGSSMDGEDTFQEAMIIFDRNIRAGKFNKQSALTTYFIGICKWHWLGQQRKANNNGTLELKPELVEIADELSEQAVLDVELMQLVKKILDNMGEPCRTLLTLWMAQYSGKEIAERLNYTDEDGKPNAGTVKKYVYRCRERLSKNVQGDPDLINTLNQLR